MPTQSELRSLVRRDPLLNSTTVISDADLNTLLNEGALDLARLAEAFIVSATWSAASSASLYVLSGASAKVSNFLEVAWDMGLVYTPSAGVTKTSPHHFQWVSEFWLDLHLPGWQDAAASDTLQYAYLTHDPSGYLNLGVYPASKTATPSFKLYYLSRGADMSANGNYPWTNTTTNLTHTEPFQKAIADYASWMAHAQITHRDREAAAALARYQARAAAFKEAQQRYRAAEWEGQTRAGQLETAEAFGGL